MMGLVKKIGSIGFTIFISIALIILLIISTSMEALHGTPFAQKVFYHTRWFDLVIALLWLNIFCSTILRIPFKKEHIGFLVTHIGILGILAGALITRAFAIEGELLLYEGESSNRIRTSGYALTVRFPNKEEVQYPLQKGDARFFLTPARLNAKEPFCPLKTNGLAAGDTAAGRNGTAVPFRVTEVLEHAAQSIKVSQGPEGAPFNYAVRVAVKSQQLAVDKSIWLIEHEPSNEFSTEAMAGPVKLLLKPDRKAPPPQKPTIKVLDKSGQEILTIDVDQKVIPKQIPVAKTGFVIKNLAYYPFASVVDKKLMNYPQGKRFNPAVEYDLVDSKGRTSHAVNFAFFPDFESMHGSVKGAASELRVNFEAGAPEDVAIPFDGVQLVFTYDQEGLFRYQAKTQESVLSEGVVVIGKPVALGIMGLEFNVAELYSKAGIAYEVGPDKAKQGPLAVGVVLPESGTADVHWALENQSTPVHLPEGVVYLTLTPMTFEIPFSVALKQFRKINYPGTMDSAAFESDVVLQDAKQRVTLERTISMNAPLLYDGYKVFQSSYIEDPQYGKASIFTVAKNPGIAWIYVSSVLACLGAMFQFYGVKEKEPKC